MFTAFLDTEDARRASGVVSRLSALSFRAAALTGSLAIESHFVANGYPPQRRVLNDLDFVVESIASISSAPADGFLVHHIHPDAPPGKILLQLIDRDHALRIDFFRSLGATLSRAGTLYGPAGPLKVVSIEDLAARTTSYVYAQLRKTRPVEAKHAQTFKRLAGLGTPKKLGEAWQDHRQDHNESFLQACDATQRLLTLHPELFSREKYSNVVIPCGQCRDYGPFQRANPATIVETLGYW